MLLFALDQNKALFTLSNYKFIYIIYSLYVSILKEIINGYIIQANSIFKNKILMSAIN